MADDKGLLSPSTSLAETHPPNHRHGLSRPLPSHEVVDVSPEEAVHLLDYWRLILKRRWTVLSVFVIVVSTLMIATLKQTPVYQGKVTVEINPEQPNVLSFREVLQLTSSDVDSYRETQYKVLQSRTLAERVVRDLGLHRNPEFYRSKSLFGLFERDPDRIPGPSDVGPPDPSSQAFRNAVRNLQASIDVSPVRRSNLVEVAVYSEDRRLAPRIANYLANQYTEQNLEVKWDETIKASEWLSGRLVDLKAKLEKSEDVLQTYAQRNAILFIDEKKTSVTARLDQLQSEHTKAQAERFQKEAMHSLVESGQVQELPGFLSNNLIQQLSLRLADLERDYAQMTALVKPDYPKAVQIKKQIDALQASLDREKQTLTQNVTDDYRAALERERYLAEALERQGSIVNDIAEKSIQYNILKREVDTSKQMYDGVLQRLKEAQVSAGLKASNIRVMDPAELPGGPVKPRILLNLALGIVLGLGLGIGLAFFQEYLDNTLKTPDEVEQLLRLPSLGALPKFGLNGAKRDEVKALVPADGDEAGEEAIAPAVQNSPEALEAFRSLRTSILLSANPVPKLLLITSALPSEGKTTTTVNLGATLASLGSKVVIVDCDMRKPACHRSAGVKNSPGFVQCLTGQVKLDEAVLPVPGVPNLSVIPCGPIPPNPAEVLSSSVTADVLRQLRSTFEYVLVDSPPLLSVSDSRILATLVDAVVLVVRAHQTPYDVVRRARAMLYGVGARVLGVALNSIDPKKDGFGDYYRYGHGSAYGADPDASETERDPPRAHE